MKRIESLIGPISSRANGVNWIRQPSTLKTFPFAAPNWCINLLLLFTVHLQPFKHRQNRFPFDNCLTDSMRREMCLIHLVSKTRKRDDDWWKLAKFFLRDPREQTIIQKGVWMDLLGLTLKMLLHVCNAILNRNIFHEFLSAQHKFKQLKLGRDETCSIKVCKQTKTRKCQ